MRNRLKQIYLCLFLFQWVWMLLFMTMFTKQPKSLTERIENNEPTVFAEARNYFSDLTDYAVQGSCLYILYDMVGVVEIYTLEGKYLRSYVFPWRQNGGGELLVMDDGLLLCTRDYDYFLFRDGLYLEARPELKSENIYELEKSAKSKDEKRSSANGSVFVRKGPSIYREWDGNSEAIVKRPIYDLLMQGIAPFIQQAVVLLLGIPFADNLPRRRRKRQAFNARGEMRNIQS